MATIDCEGHHTYLIPEVIELKVGDGLLSIRKDAVKTVQALSYAGRNLSCLVNGIETEEGYDNVLKALEWEPEDF